MKSEQKAFAALRNEFARAWQECGIFEWIALVYMALSSALIAVYAKNLAYPVRLVAAQAIVALLILALCCVYARSERRAISLRREILDEVLAFLAALVSAPVFSFLL